LTTNPLSLYQIETTARTALLSSAGLPGLEAHAHLAPKPRHGWAPGVVPDGARAAAGLVLLYPIENRVHVLLTVRSHELSSHAGQVSFPGGRVEADETLPQAALRETAEEVGIAPAGVRVLGHLSTLYIPVSDFALHPILGTTSSRPPFRPATAEVSRILEASLDTLGTVGPRCGYRWRGPERFDVPYFEVAGERVWGATAMVLAEVLALIGTPVRDPWTGAAPSPPRGSAENSQR
jgi:8-oxo-dGTP pyrophosphatase MutT (NUDIX family)